MTKTPQRTTPVDVPVQVLSRTAAEDTQLQKLVRACARGEEAELATADMITAVAG
jgi:hypothetical protein